MRIRPLHLPTLAACIALGFAVFGTASAAPAAEKRSSPALDATHALHALFDSEWERGLVEDPIGASYLGDARFNDRWPDLSTKALIASHAADQAVLTQLAAIDRAALTPADQLNYDLFRRDYENRIARWGFHEQLVPLTPRGGVQTLSELTEVLPFKSAKDYSDWATRLENFAPLVEQTMALMREGLRQRITAPQVIMQRVSGQLAKQIVGNPTESPYYAPFASMPDSIPAAERNALKARANKAIAKVVVPAYKRFQKFFEDEYLPNCRKSIGVSALPDGKAYYAFLAKHYTTTDLTPAQIHQIGLDEVKRIHAEMERVIEQVGFKGSFQDFLHFLRTDPRFYFTDPQQLYDAYAVTAKRIDPELVKLFGKLPRTPYGVRPIPDITAPNTYTAYYQPGAADGTRAGYFYVNLYKPETRPKYEIEVLTSHEAVPGHHLQLALQNELGELPMFRRQIEVTAFVEGWALYAESLGEEIGLYQDPYSKFGELTYDMWRAVRLVIDTGIHNEGWTREQAIQYFHDNTAKSDNDIAQEVDRYISWPGQALGYKIGQLRIKALRAKAEQALGPRFDLRAFHDVVLSQGAIPLDVLERTVDDWIAKRQAEGTLTETPVKH